jgi:hypothetical protein
MRPLTPAFFASSTRGVQWLMSRTPAYTVHPSAAYAIALLIPMPLRAPVMSTTLASSA